MHRRSFLRGVFAAAMVGAPRQAWTAETCESDFCEVGIPNIVMTPAQQCEQWCWAASIQAIFQLHNHSIDQKRIVQKLFNGLVCAPATNPQMFAAINGPWVDDSGQPFTAQTDVLYDPIFGIARPDALNMMINDLKNGNPLINGALGHATIITAIRYRTIGPGPSVIWAVVRDPWPLNPNKRYLAPSEMMGTTFIARVIVS